MKYIPHEYLNRKVRLTKKGGRIVFGIITRIDSNCICFETKSMISLLGIGFLEDICLAEHNDIPQIPPVENKPKKKSHKGKFLYSKFWKDYIVKETIE